MKKIDLKSLLVENGITQFKFSVEAGVCLATIHKYCNKADYLPSLLVHNKIKKAAERLNLVANEGI